MKFSVSSCSMAWLSMMIGGCNQALNPVPTQDESALQGELVAGHLNTVWLAIVSEVRDDEAFLSPGWRNSTFDFRKSDGEVARAFISSRCTGYVPSVESRALITAAHCVWHNQFVDRGIGLLVSFYDPQKSRRTCESVSPSKQLDCLNDLFSQEDKPTFYAIRQKPEFVVHPSYIDTHPTPKYRSYYDNDCIWTDSDLERLEREEQRTVVKPPRTSSGESSFDVAVIQLLETPEDRGVTWLKTMSVAPITPTINQPLSIDGINDHSKDRFGRTFPGGLSTAGHVRGIGQYYLDEYALSGAFSVLWTKYLGVLSALALCRPDLAPTVVGTVSVEQGDSGGPLYLQDENGNAFVYGLNSKIAQPIQLIELDATTFGPQNPKWVNQEYPDFSQWFSQQSVITGNEVYVQRWARIDNETDYNGESVGAWIERIDAKFSK